MMILKNTSGFRLNKQKGFSFGYDSYKFEPNEVGNALTETEKILSYRAKFAQSNS